MISYIYCRSWFNAKKKALNIIDQKTAQYDHNARQMYTVLISKDEIPKYVIIVKDTFVCVCVLDHLLRIYLEFHYEEVHTSRLFMRMAIRRSYEQNTDNVLDGRSYIYKTSGDLCIRQSAYNSPETKILHSHVDVSGYYAQYPEFGQYMELIERGLAHKFEARDNR
ncbi:hypothetical protein KS4_01180 [Poriferisphaera corsica]|uniref:Uncharacterized protein n=1 Tax=Poriferisphaera corsica TaxID=2528020 RepID=A0A517YPE7_9BACT|nr:hypothetical protein [Poriferisphaera corsica]QDU32089.1 hypothetical protein KS4_01180 [Poriferisphaera corsica]